MNRNQAKAQRERREARWDAGGEGSRGGKVIGHTSSGKPIYKSHGHPSHADFNGDDHKEAVVLHKKESRKMNGFARSFNDQLSTARAGSERHKELTKNLNEFGRRAEFHEAQADLHRESKKKAKG